MQLGDILGYRLDMVRCAALRSLHRKLAGKSLRPADTTALLLIRDEPGCDQTRLGKALAGNRSVGMKIASRLATRGLVTRGPGRDRRSKGLYITAAGLEALADLLGAHARAEAVLASCLAPGERGLLMALLARVEQAVLDEEAALAGKPAPANDDRAGRLSA